MLCPSQQKMTFNIVLVILGTSALTSAQFSYREDRASSLLLGQNPCVSKQTCSECMQTPTCAWCMQPDYLSADGSPLPRCNQEEFFQSAIKKESRSQCASHLLLDSFFIALWKNSSWLHLG